MAEDAGRSLIHAIADVIRGNCCNELGADRPITAHDAFRRAEGIWTRLTRNDVDVYPLVAESLGVRFYLVRGFGPERLEANVWDGARWRRVWEATVMPGAVAAD